jgi:hypothetical protein
MYKQIRDVITEIRDIMSERKVGKERTRHELFKDPQRETEMIVQLQGRQLHHVTQKMLKSQYRLDTIFCKISTIQYS